MYVGLQRTQRQRTQKRNKKMRSRETALLEPEKFMVRPIRIERMTLGLGGHGSAFYTVLPHTLRC